MQKVSFPRSCPNENAILAPILVEPDFRLDFGHELQSIAPQHKFYLLQMMVEQFLVGRLMQFERLRIRPELKLTDNRGVPNSLIVLYSGL